MVEAKGGNKMKKILLISSLIASSFLLSVGGTTTTYAEGEETSSTPSSEVVSSESSSSDKKISLEDKDGDGIPDAITDYYNEKIRDQYLFGISLGALIGTATSLLGTLWTIKKNSSSNKLFKTSIGTQDEKLKELDAKLVEYEKLIKELETQRENQTTDSTELLKKNEAQISEMLESLEESVKVLQNYSNIETKMNAIITCLELMASTQELVKSGVASEVTKTLNEVK